MSASGFVYVQVEKIKAETEKAFLCVIDGEDVWIPKKCVADPEAQVKDLTPLTAGDYAALDKLEAQAAETMRTMFAPAPKEDPLLGRASELACKSLTEEQIQEWAKGLDEERFRKTRSLYIPPVLIDCFDDIITIGRSS